MPIVQNVYHIIVQILHVQNKQMKDVLLILLAQQVDFAVKMVIVKI